MKEGIVRAPIVPCSQELTFEDILDYLHVMTNLVKPWKFVKSFGSKSTDNINMFWSMELWPPNSLNLNSLDF